MNFFDIFSFECVQLTPSNGILPLVTFNLGSTPSEATNETRENFTLKAIYQGFVCALFKYFLALANFVFISAVHKSPLNMREGEGLTPEKLFVDKREGEETTPDIGKSGMLWKITSKID